MLTKDSRSFSIEPAARGLAVDPVPGYKRNEVGLGFRSICPISMPDEGILRCITPCAKPWGWVCSTAGLGHKFPHRTVWIPSSMIWVPLCQYPRLLGRFMCLVPKTIPLLALVRPYLMSSAECGSQSFKRAQYDPKLPRAP
jgi:hypothetical protein